MPTNLAVDDEVAAMVTNDRSTHFGRVDILVNNAAITFPGDVDLPMKRYDLIFAVNTRAPLIAVQAGAPGHAANAARARSSTCRRSPR